MQPLRVRVRNIRGAGDVELHVRPLNALIGPNNAGKSTLLDAIRLFYDTLRWDAARDRPWDCDPQEPSWVEITYRLTDEEIEHLEVGQLTGNRLDIRRYFSGERNGKYYFTPAEGDETWTGWPEVAGRLGQCVYVPAMSPVHDQTSLNGPSPLRDVMLLAFSDRGVDGALAASSQALQSTRHLMKTGPVADLEKALGEALRPWGLTARIGIGGLTNEFIINHLVDLTIEQEGTERPMETQGSGVQRSLVAALIQAAAQLRNDADENAFRWILFEEPEAYLHPAQVARLTQDLAKIASVGNATVTITTHDPTTLSAGETPLEGLVRVHRWGTRTRAISPDPETVGKVLEAIHLRSAYAQSANHCFKRKRMTPAGEEHSRLLYDLDARRSAAFFADQVIVVEGHSDAVLFEWLGRRGHLAFIGPNVGVLDAGGKYELHRAVSILTLFQIPHVVVWDEDAAMRVSGSWEQYQQKCRDDAALEALRAAAETLDVSETPAPADEPAPAEDDPLAYEVPYSYQVELNGRASTRNTNPALLGGVRLSGTIEKWLGIDQEGEGAWKASNLATALGDAFTDPASAVRERVLSLIGLIADLFDGHDVSHYADHADFAHCLIERRFAPPTVDFAAEAARPAPDACTCRPQWQRSVPH
ncbi:AAA family ATPase [Actinomadura sp. DC4]|uniref:ATP-dependent nuclease n=1 Tax=Actinomadura sp. DC4 TaxID=3055069 RepID=UPI0025B22470|nr:AAA family ATPase [Actinomadura sp. DC4]MDN3351884.1 AAA family ATPase [Actinomadura sp. DC4]